MDSGHADRRLRKRKTCEKNENGDVQKDCKPRHMAGQRCAYKSEDGDAMFLLKDKWLLEMMGDRPYVKGSEFSQDLLLQYLVNSGGGKIVNKLFSVNVQTLNGAEYNVNLDDKVNKSVSSLKSAIEKAEGTRRPLQELFLLDKKSAHQNNPSQHNKLSDSQIIGQDCDVLLCIKHRADFEWDVNSPLVTRKMFKITGENNSIATKISNGDDYNNCLLVDSPAMEPGTGVYTISFAIRRGQYSFIGVVQDGTPFNEDPFDVEKDSGWAIFLDDGSLLANNIEGDFPAGKIDENQVLTLQLDTSAHTLNFFVDGSPHGPGHTNVTGSLRWAMNSAYVGENFPTFGYKSRGDVVQIVCNPELDLAFAHSFSQ
jgi:hypothetical protein